MKRARKIAIAATVLSLASGAAHCGRTTADGADASGGGSDGGDGAVVRGRPPADLIADAGLCASPSGWAVCGGPNHCFTYGGALCTECSLAVFKNFMDASSAYSLGVCFNEWHNGEPEAICGDNCVYIQAVLPAFWDSFPFDVGYLFAANGAADRVRYADMSFWTGAPLPPIESCTVDGGVATCGGNCPPCAAGRTCTGRSPLHPLGLCVPDVTCGPKIPCPSGQSCYSFKVQADAQATADANYTYCLPTAECEATAANLPGGGYCRDPQ